MAVNSKIIEPILHHFSRAFRVFRFANNLSLFLTFCGNMGSFFFEFSALNKTNYYKFFFNSRPGFEKRSILGILCMDPGSTTKNKVELLMIFMSGITHKLRENFLDVHRENVRNS